MTFKTAAILSDQTMYLDHLIPICSLLDAPLFVSDEKVLDFAKRYYPLTTPVQFRSTLDLSPDFLVKNFDLILHPYFWANEQNKSLFYQAEQAHQKEVRFLYVPHGNSDKGWHTYWMENYGHLDRALIYGKHMKDFLDKKDALPDHFTMGNLRQHYYLKNRNFFDSQVEKKVRPYLDTKKKTLLYAPTWADHENSCSLFSSIETIVEQILPFWNLIVKMHPMIAEKMPAQAEVLFGSLEGKQNLVLLEEFPPVYPLFSLCDAYLGDYSSIGYDFLSIDKPLFFLNPSERPMKDPSRFLHQCGIDVSKESDLKKALESEDTFKAKRKEIYEYAFSPVTPLELKDKIHQYYLES